MTQIPFFPPTQGDMARFWRLLWSLSQAVSNWSPIEVLFTIGNQLLIVSRTSIGDQLPIENIASICNQLPIVNRTSIRSLPAVLGTMSEECGHNWSLSLITPAVCIRLDKRQLIFWDGGMQICLSVYSVGFAMAAATTSATATPAG